MEKSLNELMKERRTCEAILANEIERHLQTMQRQMHAGISKIEIELSECTDRHSNHCMFTVSNVKLKVTIYLDGGDRVTLP